MAGPCEGFAPAIINGVDVSAWVQTMQVAKLDGAAAQFSFRATNSWLGGDRNRTTIANFSGVHAKHRINKTFACESSQPHALLGTDEAPSPVEWLLHALIACITTTTVHHAAARGIAIAAIESTLSGDIDIRGYLSVSPDARPGYSAIRVDMRVKANATPEAITALAYKSPVLDIVSRGTSVNLNIETH